MYANNFVDEMKMVYTINYTVCSSNGSSYFFCCTAGSISSRNGMLLPATAVLLQFIAVILAV